MQHFIGPLVRKSTERELMVHISTKGEQLQGFLTSNTFHFKTFFLTVSKYIRGDGFGGARGARAPPIFFETKEQTLPLIFVFLHGS